MNSQLPQNLRTSKFDSLPDDARQLAEELIRDKFDVAEVVDGGRKRGNDFFDPADTVNSHVLMGEVSTERGYRWRFAITTLAGMDWDYQRNQPREASGYSARIVDELVDKIQNEIQKFEERQRQESRHTMGAMSGSVYAQSYYDPAKEITLEFIGRREICQNFSDIRRFIEMSYRGQSEFDRMYQGKWL